MQKFYLIFIKIKPDFNCKLYATFSLGGLTEPQPKPLYLILLGRGGTQTFAFLIWWYKGKKGWEPLI